ncbi:TPA: class C sortase [Enterococcus faecium]|uniref:Sortase n=4 Tax=Enterococcus TaxID=1350 RepID=A0A828ZTB6_ENTFC|nr:MULTISPECIES: class C sortase [Enterococcus]EGP4724462.1 class C sortase [Enterococcus faecium]EGP4811031.1 class C sortase [Enterococcus faecium]EGP4929887.1 class C sortase [Enterococcus faecium]EGP4952990.1 class C sortase [Enterococcus faecium]EGP4958276.1 class C sortase [Enterococcus faecium]
MKKKKWRLLDLIMLSVFFIGVLSLAYPFVSDTLNDYLDQQVIKNYQKKAKSEHATVLAELQKRMIKKNEQLASNEAMPEADSFSKKKKNDQKSQKSYIESHTVGVLTIPKINVNLPIFDQTTMKLLEKGACLLEGTSYPIGGKSTHAVLSSHRGLSQAKLFTNLPQLKIKDHFYIEINGQYLAYQVDQIKTVEPTETEALQIQEDQDLVTLVTCTPYMINSHRLLVRGHRIVVEPEEIKESLEKVKQAKCTAFLLVSGLIGVLLLLFLVILIKFLKK